MDSMVKLHAAKLIPPGTARASRAGPPTKELVWGAVHRESQYDFINYVGKTSIAEHPEKPRLDLQAVRKVHVVRN